MGVLEGWSAGVWGLPTLRYPSFGRVKGKMGETGDDDAALALFRATVFCVCVAMVLLKQMSTQSRGDGRGYLFI